MKTVKLYDTTLRDGAQGEGVSFSVESKLFLLQCLDDMGFDYVEGGWPGSNPKDIDFFRRVKGIPHLKHARLAAFSSTKRSRIKIAQDPNIQQLLKAETPVITIFGKAWDLHVSDVLKVSLDENLQMITDTVSYLKSRVAEVIFDAEHFFDGYKNNPGYALRALLAAHAAGAGCLCLCDTNGGTLTQEIAQIVQAVKGKINTPLGIHVHNDSGLAVANSLIAVQLGVTQVQGTINGYGERSGNADLCVIIPNLKLKLGINCISDDKLAGLTDLSQKVYKLANLPPAMYQPYVGPSAFAHKAGVHVDAIKKNPVTYEHIKPEKIGNRRHIVVSELSGKSNISFIAEEFNIDMTRDTNEVRAILESVKVKEHEGYQYEDADASLRLLFYKALKTHRTFFKLENFKVVVENLEGRLVSEATIRLMVKGAVKETTAEGDGPVNALDRALRKILEQYYTSLEKVRLMDYQVRVVNARAGTAAKVRVNIKWEDLGKDVWNTVGVSENIIEASWEALVDGIEYKLLKDKVM